MKCYLRIGNDYLEDAERCNSIGDAKAEFMDVALQLDRFGQRIEASIHIVDKQWPHDINEYPDFVLSLGPRGGLKCERT